MQPQIKFRDDDIGLFHTISDGVLLQPDRIFKAFVLVDALFKKYKVKHVIAVITKDLEVAEELVNYIKKNPHIEVQLHCNTHLNFTELSDEELVDQFTKGKRKIFELFGKEPEIFYPPWNKTDKRVEEFANAFDLQVSSDKMSLSGYLRGHKKDVINFHYWADECKDLEQALIKYVNSRDGKL